MAQNVTIAGNQYPSVPSIQIPKTGGGGNATFTDTSPTTASASDVAQGKIFFDSTGSQQTGTASGGEDYAPALIARTISGTYSNTTITKVGNYAFYGCSNLSYISLPAVTSIGASAFVACSKLKEAIFPNATYVGQGAFYGCYSLITASFPNASTVRDSTFYNCTSLFSAFFSTASSIGTNAFYSCARLQTADIPNAKSIGNTAFSGCTALASASFPSATFIGTSAFYACSTITNVIFPVAVSVGASAFYACRSIAFVSFPLVNSLGAGVFRSCQKLESAYFLGSSVPTLGANAFTSTPMSASSWIGYWGSIFVKESLLASFQAATNWSLYSARMVGLTDAQIEALS